jgi:hypothetical protein
VPHTPDPDPIMVQTWFAAGQSPASPSAHGHFGVAVAQAPGSKMQTCSGTPPGQYVQSMVSPVQLEQSAMQLRLALH